MVNVQCCMVLNIFVISDSAGTGRQASLRNLWFKTVWVRFPPIRQVNNFVLFIYFLYFYTDILSHF